MKFTEAELVYDRCIFQRLEILANLRFFVGAFCFLLSSTCPFRRWNRRVWVRTMFLYASINRFRSCCSFSWNTRTRENQSGCRNARRQSSTVFIHSFFPVQAWQSKQNNTHTIKNLSSSYIDCYLLLFVVAVWKQQRCALIHQAWSKGSASLKSRIHRLLPALQISKKE